MIHLGNPKTLKNKNFDEIMLFALILILAHFLGKRRSARGGVGWGGVPLWRTKSAKLGHPVLWAGRLSFETRTKEMSALYDWFCSSQHKKTKTTLGTPTDDIG